MAEDKRLPLAGIRVVDLTHVLAGPYCTMMLADLGAEVYKIEKPGRGDTTRGTPPFFGEWSHYFVAVNRNKVSVGLDIKQPEGKRVLLRMIEQSDVVVNNFRPGVLDGQGLGYADLAAVNPRIINCSISGFGQYGSLAQKTAFDLIAQAMSGFMSVIGEPGGPPLRCGVSLGDVVASTFALAAIMTALYDRERTGRGQDIDISMLDCLVSYLTYYVTLAQATGQAPPPVGSQHATVVPMGAYRTRDGYLAIAAFNQGFWLSMCDAISRPELKDDPRFRTMRDRQRHRDELMAILYAVIAQETSAYWEQRFAEFDVPCGPILTIPEVIALPHLEERGMLAELALGERRVKVAAQPMKFSGLASQLRQLPPVQGAATREALCVQFGLEEQEYAALRERGILS